MSNAVAEALHRLTAEAVESNALKREENARRRREEDEAAFQLARANLEIDRNLPTPGFKFSAYVKAMPFFADIYAKQVPQSYYSVEKDGSMVVDCPCGGKHVAVYDYASACVGGCDRSYLNAGKSLRVAKRA